MAAVFDVFWRFLLLGCVSFGGPAAHIGYFQQVFVQRLHWLSAADYAQLVALSQFLPGPGSSQVGFALGHRRAGLPGALAAFIGFTLPSFLLMLGVALFAAQFAEAGWLDGLVRGLKLLAAVVVAEAVRSMAGMFCRHWLGAALAVATGLLLLWSTAAWLPYLALLAAALLGAAVLPAQVDPAARPPAAVGPRWPPLVVFFLLFALLPVLADVSAEWRLSSQFYHSGSLVFGGGHVVLPLLQQQVGDALGEDRFLLGYAAAQAVPGPMFSLAAFLGAELLPARPVWGALLATLAIFLPGFLLVLGLQTAWRAVAARPRVLGLVAGVNAAVVGLLAAAWVNPIAGSALHGWLDVLLVSAGWAVLLRWRPPILVLVAGFAGIGLLMGAA
ncbi:chromate efflux transporter [Haliea sp.]|uniref:chromate efflux transporter n=1 Tax=Haliea sp. TaxID=1932666 RepID=UPI0035287814